MRTFCLRKQGNKQLNLKNQMAYGKNRPWKAVRFDSRDIIWRYMLHNAERQDDVFKHIVFREIFYQFVF